ncbi:MAG TPA: arylesterase [Brevundimonas sp.]|jgi:acyl-CoA thioesterase-1|uniref:arylesterase n=1 Tax=Brevundimonas sp. TaxID=1871086 RepID=UPI002ED7FD89
MKPVITLLGDSISAGFGLRPSEALPNQLEIALAGLGVDATVWGSGVSGDASADGLRRIARAVHRDTALCVVAFGGNDLMQLVAPDRTEANLTAIIEWLEARDIAVVLAGMRAPPWAGVYGLMFDQTFARLSRRRGLHVYPFLLEGVALTARYNLPDRIHPNAEGVKVIARGLAPVVAKALADRTAFDDAGRTSL